jgi:uncharacterized protein (TIGR02271 family)
VIVSAMTTLHIVRADGAPRTVVRRTAVAGEDALLVVAFADGSRLVVPESALEPRADGSYQVRAGTAIAGSDEPVVIPLAAEELSVGTRRVARGVVRARTRVETREEVVDEPLLSERIEVERVPINRLVEGDPPGVRDEDGVLVVPILEEVLVVEKRLRLKEEVRLVRRRVTVREPQRVTLRREVVEIERADPEK